ncbi:SMI1/KNR4 family protein [Planococcus plakortidis]
MHVWAKEGEDDYKLPETSEVEIEKIENQLDMELPASYKEILLEQNGGIIQYNSVKKESHLETNAYIEINHIYGCGQGGILDSDYLIDEWGLPKNILIFSGDGNSFFALDYRKDSVNPSVIYLEPETEEIIEVAHTFDEFLNNLSKEEVFFENDEDDEDWGTSEEAAETIFSGNDILLIEETLLNLQYPENHKWYFEQLLKCATHSEALIRETVTNILNNNLEIYIIESDKKLHFLLKEIIEKLFADKNESIRSEAREIRKRIKYKHF